MNLLHFIDREYPTKHSFLESIYTLILPNYGISVYWIAICSTNKRFLEIKRWNRSIVFTFKKPKSKSITAIWVLNLKIILASVKIFLRIRPEMLQIRNWVFGWYIAYLLKLFFKKKIIFQHSFPRELLLQDRINNKGYMSKIRAIFELFWLKILLRKTDYVFAISKTMRQQFINNGFEPHKVLSVGLAFDENLHPDNSDIEDILNNNKLRGKRVVMYFGVMDTQRKLEFLIDIWKEVGSNFSEVILLMVGGSEEDIYRLKAYSKMIGIYEKIIFTGFVPRKVIPSYLNICEFTISPIPPEPMYQVSSVTKVYESLGFGRPVVGNELPEQGQLIRDSCGGICVNYNKKEFVKAITYLLKEPSVTSSLGNSGREFVLKNHTYQILSKQIIDFYSSLLQ